MKRKSKGKRPIRESNLRVAAYLRAHAELLEDGQANVLRGEITESEPPTISIASIDRPPTYEVGTLRVELEIERIK
jgi:hypothetical protein